MVEIGAYEAKTRLPALLERVRRGERITITKHGVPVAELVPHQAARRRKVADVIADLRRFREQHRLDGLSIKDLIEEGRR